MGVISVLSYNIQSGSDMHYKYNLTAQGLVIRDAGASIDSVHRPHHHHNNDNYYVAALQEVDNGTRRHWPDDQLAILSKVSGMPHYRLGKMRDFQGGAYGIGIMQSRAVGPMRHTAVFRFHPPGKEPGECGDPLPEDYCQGALATLLVHPTTTTTTITSSSAQHHRHDMPSPAVWVVTTHLGIGAHALEEARQLMVEFVRGQLLQPQHSHSPPSPPPPPPPQQVVLTGDFNVRPESEVVRYILYGDHGLRCVDTWAECGSGPGYTFPADRPDRRIDYQFLCTSPASSSSSSNARRSKTMLRCRSATVISTLASDHRPLLVQYEWRHDL